MDSDTKQRVEAKVREILGTADMDTVTELKVRDLVAGSLGVELSDIDSKKLVREVVEAYLLSASDCDNQIRVRGDGSDGKENANGNLAGEENGEQPPKASERGTGGEIPANRSGDDGLRFLCKLSNKRSVAIKDSVGEKVVLVGEFLWKDGKRVPVSRGIGLTAEQWLTFRKSFPAIEEAIRKVKSQIRLEVERKQSENLDKSDPLPTTVDVRFQPQLKKHKSDTCPEEEASQKQIHKNPIVIVRFDGKNYHDWARRMELFLEQLNLAYVLTGPCPTAVEAQKWMDDDYICRTNILSSLSDKLRNELKLIYLTEEHGSKVSLVKKYMEFQMMEGKSAVVQAQELHELADSLTPLGMHVQECFHVLPVSWKDVGVKLMRENNLPVWMLMNSLKQEEELRREGKRGALPTITGDRERKLWFCSICQRKGHSEEKCWFKNNKFERGKSSTVVPRVEERDPK